LVLCVATDLTKNSNTEVNNGIQVQKDEK
jgi:hypothetical protein